jgi:hypothetical protein
MYNTAQEAKEAAIAVIKKNYGGYVNDPFVILERKLHEQVKDTWYGFRTLICGEAFSGEWKQEYDGSFSRMIEVVHGGDK